uniref:Uncharacterized protein n=1 Tax=viral metagenome TaxID=1070528 RepID=A0A6C0CZI0_9ZZZZ
MNLENNLKQFDVLLCNNVHVFILTNKLQSGNYSPENENKMISIFNKYNCKVHFIKYIEDIPEYDVDMEKQIASNYYTIANYKDGYSPFVPEIIYRKYLLNKLKNDYIENNNLDIDLHFCCRLFDTVIKRNNQDIFIQNEFNNLFSNQNIIMGSHDTTYIGNRESIDYTLNLAEKFYNNNIYKADIWKDEGFYNFFINIDYCLGTLKTTFAPEVQYASHIYFSQYKYQNIRFDFTNPNNQNNKSTLFNIRVCPNRK